MSGDAENSSGPYDYSYYDKGVYDHSSSGDMDTFRKVFLPILYILVFIFGLIGNGLVVCVVVNQRKRITLPDMCLFNMALSDLLFILILPFYAHYSVVSEWTFGNFMCHFAAVLYHSGFFSSIIVMVIVTIDRYMIILHSVYVTKYRTMKLGIALTVFVWMVSLGVSLPGAIFTKVTNVSYGESCIFRPENDAWMYFDLFAKVILGLVIPLFVMIVCYSRMIPRLVKMRTAKRHRVIKLIFTIVVAFFLCWGPYNICFALYTLEWEGSESASFAVTLAVTETFAYTHCCWNPIIYAFMGQRFIKQASQLMRKWFPVLYSPSLRGFSETSFRKSSNMSKSSIVLS